MDYSNNKYSEIKIHPHAHEMLHRLSRETYIYMNQLVGMYIADQACLLDSIGRYAYWKHCETKFDEAEETLEYFEPSESNKYTGKIKIYQHYLAKLREIAWSINVRPKDFLNYMISAEFGRFVNLNKELNEVGFGQYMRHLGECRLLMDALFDPLITYIYMTCKQNAGGKQNASVYSVDGGNTFDGGNTVDGEYTFDGGNTVDGEYTWRETGFIPASKLKEQYARREADGGDSMR